MKRRDFFKNAGAFAASATFMGASSILTASENKKLVQLDSMNSVEEDDLDAKLDKPVTVIVLGAGNRGSTYSYYSQCYPASFKIVGVSDINEFRRKVMSDRFNVPEEHRFGDWSEVFKQPKFADFVIVSTPDHLHHGPCMKALEMGYHVLLEKPAATSEKDCTDILNQAHKYNKIVGEGHVLRYAPYWQAVKKTVTSSQIGNIVSVQHLEPVSRFHFAHSYVRGNWNNSHKSSPMVISKSCHDLDIIRWLGDKPCKKVTAFGDLRYFKASNAPKGVAA